MAPCKFRYRIFSRHSGFNLKDFLYQQMPWKFLPPLTSSGSSLTEWGKVTGSHCEAGRVNSCWSKAALELAGRIFELGLKNCQPWSKLNSFRATGVGLNGWGPVTESWRSTSL